jgi:hypothetical protein
VKIVEVTVGKPMGSFKGQHSRERRTYPAEVRFFPSLALSLVLIFPFSRLVSD